MSHTEDTLVNAPVPSPGLRPRPSRRALISAGLIAAALVAAIVVLETGAFNSGSTGGGGVVDNSYPIAFTHIRRQGLLTEQTEVSATLTYAGAATVVVPAGTAPSAVTQDQQQVTTDQSMLATDAATLSADGDALSQARAALTAAQEKQAVDCAGANAAAGSSSSSGANGNGAATPCASDSQTVTADQQSVTADAAKVTADTTQLSGARSSLTGAQQALALAQSSGTSYGQASTYTALPSIGEVVRRGQTLYSVSGQPVVLLYGSVSPYRSFAAGMSPGDDVTELNANLDALGYGHGLSGDAFTAATAAAIDAFQAAHGLAQTGQLLLGSVVFEPGAVRVTAVTPTVGQTVMAGALMTVTSLVRQVQIALDAAEQSDVAVGDPVTITMPNNSTLPGKVSYVGTVATTPSSNNNSGSSSPTIEVNVAPDDPAATGTLDQVPVNVSITTGSVRNPLVVPVDALLALSSGGYAVEEVTSTGAHVLVGVSLGLFDDADGNVQVTGAGLAAGQRIVIPNI